MYHDGQTLGCEGFQGGDCSLEVFLRQLHTEDSSKLAAQARHSALEPVAFVFSYDRRYLVDQAGTVGSNNGHHQALFHDYFLRCSRTAGKLPFQLSGPPPDIACWIMGAACDVKPWIWRCSAAIQSQPITCLH